jgi:hypothetical protein
MFAVSDREIDRGAHATKRLITPAPVHLYVLDLGGGLTRDAHLATDVEPAQILSRPSGAVERLHHIGATPTRVRQSSVVAQSAVGLSRGIAAIDGRASEPNSRLAYHSRWLCLSRH